MAGIVRYYLGLNLGWTLLFASGGALVAGWLFLAEIEVEREAASVLLAHLSGLAGIVLVLPLTSQQRHSPEFLAGKQVHRPTELAALWLVALTQSALLSPVLVLASLALSPSTPAFVAPLVAAVGAVSTVALCHVIASGACSVGVALCLTSLGAFALTGVLDFSEHSHSISATQSVCLLAAGVGLWSLLSGRRL